MTADTQLYEILKRGELCCVLTPCDIGKLVRVRAAARLREEGVTIVVLDLAALGQQFTIEEWYDALLRQLGAQLGLEAELEAFRHEHERLGPLQRWMGALREVALERTGGAPPRSGGPGWELGTGVPAFSTANSQLPTPGSRLVIFVEGIEGVRSLPFSADEFFAGIRECYNRRTEDPEFGRLTFCLMGEVRLPTLIRDTRTTAFNIGQRLELTEWSDADSGSCRPAGERKRGGAGALLKRALDWIGGEPYCCRGDLLLLQEFA